MATRDWIVEYATGSVANRQQLCTIEKWPEILKGLLKYRSEIYRSMFLYDKSIIDYVEETGSVSKYDGEKYIDTIVLDIDPTGNVKLMGDLAVDQVLELIDALHGKGICNEIIQVWFSGRGFHIHMPNVYGFEPAHNLNQIVRASIARDFGNYVDLIYDATRLIRAPYSRNLKTGLYKIPLRIEEIEDLSYTDIQEIAKDIRTDFAHKKLEYDGIALLKPQDVSRKSSPEVRKIFIGNKAETSNVITCGQHIYNAGEVKGHRHHNLLRLVSIAIRHYGYDAPAVHGIVKAYMDKFDNPLPKTEVSRIVEDAYKAGGYAYGCEDEVLSKYCDPKCFKYKWKNLEESTDVLNADDMVNLLLGYVEIDFSDKSFDLKQVFPFMPNSYVFKAGDLAVLTGNTKLGKTAFLQYVVSCIPSVKTLYMSLEVDQATMARRFTQQALLKSKDDVIHLLKQKDALTLETLKNKMKHLELITSSPDISKYGEMIQQHKPKIVVVDTVDMVPARFAGTDSFKKQEHVFETLKKIAITEDIIILAVVHISKQAHYALKEGQELDVHMSKGSTAVAQKADKILALEQVSEGSRKRRIRAVASRDDTGFEIVCNYNWETFTFGKLN